MSPVHSVDIDREIGVDPWGPGGTWGPPLAAPADVVTKPRVFTTGASRDTEQGKLDFEGFLCPLVLKRFAEHMHKNRTLADGSMRDGDNWQKGIPLEVYMKSMWRHFFDVWSSHRGNSGDLEAELCALLFNVQGYLHEVLKAKVTPMAGTEPLLTPPPTPIEITRVEGGEWQPFTGWDSYKSLHAIRYADGSVFDAVNGWRPKK